MIDCGIDLARKCNLRHRRLGAFLEEIELPTDETRFRVTPSRWRELKSVLEASPLARMGAKESDKPLRWLLVEAARVLLARVRKSCALKRWGKKLEKRAGHGCAGVAVARKLVILLHR